MSNQRTCLTGMSGELLLNIFLEGYFNGENVRKGGSSRKSDYGLYGIRLGAIRKTDTLCSVLSPIKIFQ